MPWSGELRFAETLKPRAFTFGTPASNGWAYTMPKPPRNTVLSEWKGFQAKPNRGPKLRQLVSYGVVGNPLRPRNFTTPGVPETGLIWCRSKLFIRLLASIIGVSVSQRRPRLRVRFGVTVQSS